MPATFAFYRADGDWRDKVIRCATKHPYSHAELLYDPVVDCQADCISASKRDGNKVRIKRITFEPGHWDFLTVSDLNQDECWERAEEHLDAPYDTIGAILTVTPIVTARCGRWFCSELLGHASNIPQPHTLTPGLLAQRLLCIGGKLSNRIPIGGL